MRFSRRPRPALARVDGPARIRRSDSCGFVVRRAETGVSSRCSTMCRARTVARRRGSSTTSCRHATAVLERIEHRARTVAFLLTPARASDGSLPTRSAVVDVCSTAVPPSSTCRLEPIFRANDEALVLVEAELAVSPRVAGLEQVAIRRRAGLQRLDVDVGGLHPLEQTVEVGGRAEFDADQRLAGLPVVALDVLEQRDVVVRARARCRGTGAARRAPAGSRRGSSA